jgi:glucans biosynthesis protein
LRSGRAAVGAVEVCPVNGGIPCSLSAAMGAWLVLAAPMPVDAAPEPFDRARLDATAEALSKKPHESRGMKALQALGDLSYDQYRDIRFRTEAGIWRGENRGFTLDLLHPGFLFKTPVQINVVSDGMAHELPFTTDVFDYGPLVERPERAGDLAWSGFRVRTHLNRKDVLDEFLVFQAATYFRAIGRGQVYGLSGRGLAVKTADPEGEEFPQFTRFWIERPEVGATRLVVHALLESRSLTGAYTFIVEPADEMLMTVNVTLYPRVPLEKFGLASLNSMFLFDETNRERFDDFRSAVHDSDGLQMISGRGEHIFRPLANPTELQVSAFPDNTPKGFGLMQRSRDFEDYHDAEARYELRPSAWVEPAGDWGKGYVQLVEIPTVWETSDNIVAFWQPARAWTAGKAYPYSYRVRWGGNPPGDAGVARVAATRIGAVGHEGQLLFVLDFKPPGPLPKRLDIRVNASRGKVGAIGGQHVGPTGQYRVSFRFDPENNDVSELRLIVSADGEPWSETWLYRYTTP